MIEFALAAALAGASVPDCTDMQPIAQLYNQLGQCYSKHGGDRLGKDETVTIWVRRSKNNACGKATRLIVLAKNDQACVWWKSE